MLLASPRQLPPTGLWALFFVVLTTGDCSLFHQKNFGGFFGRFRSLLRRAPRRQWSLWSNSQVFAASLLGSSTFSIFSGVLLWTRPRPALTGRYTGHASRAVPFPRPSSPQKPAWIYPRRRQRSPHLGENRPPGESELRGFSSVDLDGGASLLPGLAFPEPIQPCGSRRYFLRELAATSLLFPLPQRSGGILVQ